MNCGSNQTPLTVYILWTGGWDSTYRLVELSKTNVHIYPVYCLDSNRKSVDFELAAMQNIIQLLKERKTTRAHLSDVKIIKVEDIPKDEKITTAYKNICQTIKLGTQYDWLGRLANEYPMIEIGIEKPSGEYNGCVAAVEKHGRFKRINGRLVIDKEKSSEDLVCLFGNLAFPIADITEVEMQENIAKWGDEDIMKQIWFCHSPIAGKPCGFCRPCQQKMECNMAWLLPKNAQRRYKIWKTVTVCGAGERANGIVSLLIRGHLL